MPYTSPPHAAAAPKNNLNNGPTQTQTQVKLLLDTPGLAITGWKKKYRNLPDREEGEDNASKITRVLLAGEDVELIDSYAGGASWDEPLDVDYDGSVSYLLDTDTINRIVEYYKDIH